MIKVYITTIEGVMYGDSEVLENELFAFFEGIKKSKGELIGAMERFLSEEVNELEGDDEE